MTNIDFDLRIRVATAGAASVAGNVDFSMDTVSVKTDGWIEASGITDWGGQRVDPLAGAADQRSWSFRVGESQAGEEFTSHLSTTGNPDLLRRLLDISRSLDGGTNWTVEATGRIDSVSEVKPGVYEIRVVDERSLERDTEVFTGAATTQVYPMGITIPWGRFSDGETSLDYTVESVDNNVVRLGKSSFNTLDVRSLNPLRLRPPSGVSQLISDDVKGDVNTGKKSVTTQDTSRTTGHFETLRFRDTTNGVDRELLIVGVANVDQPPGVQLKEDGPHEVREIHLIWETSQPSVGTTISGYLYMPTHDPTEELPLHFAEKHPLEFDRDDILGASEFDISPAIDTTQYTALIDDRSVPEVLYRVTSPMRAKKAREELVHKPFGFFPTVDSNGQNSPTRFFLTGDDLPSPVPQVTDAEVGDPPEFEHVASEIRTRLEATWTSLREPFPDGPLEDFQSPEGLAADGLVASEQKARDSDGTPLEHARISTFGAKIQEINLSGIHNKRAANSWAQTYARQLFGMAGDGMTRLKGSWTDQVSSLDLGIGNVVDIAVSVTPAIGDATRGNSQLFQILSRRNTPGWPLYDLLWRSASVTALAAPTIDCSASSTSVPGDPVLWYNSEEIIGVSDGEEITAWPNAGSVGSAGDLGVRAGEIGPTYRSSALAGLPSVDFEASVLQVLEARQAFTISNDDLFILYVAVNRSNTAARNYRWGLFRATGPTLGTDKRITELRIAAPSQAQDQVDCNLSSIGNNTNAWCRFANDAANSGNVEAFVEAATVGDGYASFALHQINARRINKIHSPNVSGGDCQELTGSSDTFDYDGLILQAKNGDERVEVSEIIVYAGGTEPTTQDMIDYVDGRYGITII